MNVGFADTSFYIAFSGPKDKWHGAVKSFARDFSGVMLSTEFVLLDLANHLCAPEDRTLFLRFHEMLRNDAKTDIVPASSARIQSGLILYAARPDKGWSLTDCISMAIMRERGLSDALTTDHHFEQAGFHLLLER